QVRTCFGPSVSPMSPDTRQRTLRRSVHVTRCRIGREGALRPTCEPDVAGHATPDSQLVGVRAELPATFLNACHACVPSSRAECKARSFARSATAWLFATRVTGWVRNNRDGSVEAVLEGE